MRDVLKNLIDGLTDAWVKIGKYWRTPCKSAITQARQRLGSQVMRELFHQLVRPMANSETVGAFINGLRIVVIDGTCLDIPDSKVVRQESVGLILCFRKKTAPILRSYALSPMWSR